MKLNKRCFLYFFALILSSILATHSSLAVEQDIQIRATHKVVINTDLGPIEIELYGSNAPATVENFIGYIQAGGFSNGRFYRVVRLDNDNGAPQIEVIQGGANPEFKGFEAIPLETTKQTGIKHLDGMISMARGAPNSATSEFFICVGAQPALDFGAQRNPDGQGFAAFGRVIKGMQIVKKIHQIRDALVVDDDYVKGQILAKPVVISSIILINN